MRIIFFGTPDFAVPSLEALRGRGFEVVAVVTQPDRPHGRSRSKLVPPPVKVAALAAGIEVFQPERPEGDLFAATLRHTNPDLGVVVAYGHILKPDILAIPRLGMLNVHASYLPRWRGAAPIQAAILHGDDRTGVTIMQMDAGLDTGLVYYMSGLQIGPEDTAGTLTPRLAEIGAKALTSIVFALSENACRSPGPQQEERTTYAPKLTRAAARVPWSRTAVEVALHLRAFDPWPGAWSEGPAGEVKLFTPRLVEGRGAPGQVLDATAALVVACGEGALVVGEVKPSGGRRMTATEWLRGRPLAAGARLV
jgi:methionyl-tRNA formyltransferase